MAWVIPRDFNFKKPDWPKVCGIILIIDGIWSLLDTRLPHTPLFDLGRLIRIGIGVYLLQYPLK